MKYIQNDNKNKVCLDLSSSCAYYLKKHVVVIDWGLLMFYLLPHSLGSLMFVGLHGEGMMKFSSAITMSYYINIHFDHKDVFYDV